MPNSEATGLYGKLAQQGEQAFAEVTQRFRIAGIALMCIFSAYAISVLCLYIETSSQIGNPDVTSATFNPYLRFISAITAWNGPEHIHSYWPFLGSVFPALVLFVPGLLLYGYARERSRMVEIVKTPQSRSASN